MLRPRWRKVLSDLLGNKIRSLLVVASIAVGLFAVGMITSMYVIITADMETGYRAVNPALVGRLLVLPFEEENEEAVLCALPLLIGGPTAEQQAGPSAEEIQAVWPDPEGPELPGEVLPLDGALEAAVSEEEPRRRRVRLPPSSGRARRPQRAVPPPRPSPI